ncbi:hypothetical protein SAMN04487845_10672 [Methylobacterium sp. yr668]|nr:hypothetical protein SAMN04487845_10672 [Methylobacterium sp. yr668]
MTRIIALAGVAALLSGTVAFAQAPPPPPGGPRPGPEAGAPPPPPATRAAVPARTAPRRLRPRLRRRGPPTSCWSAATRGST